MKLGTKPYLAPELLKNIYSTHNIKYNPAKTDTFSYGILKFVVLKL